jgi:hypothetical protein
MPGTSHQADSEHVIETVVAALPTTPEGHYLITSRTGCPIGEL